ncbi:RHS repeat-associated core domain-containing protein [Streptomyces sp. LN325]|uniref:RHS repeat-associated core domain-containing protein n=1 Tax=Streptomyces sp. LN325 TaxID=3112976 RepID=UPI00371F684F
MRILAQSTEPVAQPYRFAGNYQDPTGLYHLQARYYDANFGRYTQPAPSGQEQATPSTASTRRDCSAGPTRSTSAVTFSVWSQDAYPELPHRPRPESPNLQAFSDPLAPRQQLSEAVPSEESPVTTGQT